ncbi:hypothetical protein ACHAXH_004599 [Discostella pseudostelligera]|jgi:chromosome segregation ATPase
MRASKIIPPSSANSTPHQPHHEIAKQANATATGAGSRSVDPSSELLQLRLENSELRARLDDALSHTDESKSELLQLLEEQTTQTNLLQSKCDELAAGFVEIDKERRALRKCADDARLDAMQLVERTRSEYENRCKDLEKHIKMKEREVDKLAERTREQERRIEAAVTEWHDRQAKVDELEGELEELILLVDQEREERKKAHDQHVKAVEKARIREKELERRVKDLHNALHEKEAAVANLQQDHELSKMEHKQALKTLNDLHEGARMREDELERRLQELQHALQEKEAVVANLQQDHELSKMEHQQALKTLNDMLEAQKADFASQHENINDMHRLETTELMKNLQSQIDDKVATIQSITADMKQLQTMHDEMVAEMESSIQEWKEKTQAIELKYQQSCESNDQLQEELNGVRSSYQMAQEEVKATKYLLEKENGELAKELDETKAQLAGVKDKLSNLQMEHTGLQCNYASLEDRHSDLNEKHGMLVGRTEQMTKDHDTASAQLFKQNSEIEQELKEEKSLSNKLSMQLRELSAKVSEDVSVLQKEKRDLEHELESVNAKLSMNEKETVDLHSRYQTTVSSHLNEMESLKSKHAEEISVIEMRGADIVSDLDDTIGALEKALADNKLENEQVVNSMTLDKVRLERSLYEKERKIVEQDGKILSLTAYAKERKEDVRMVKTELTHVKQTLETTKREHNDAMAAIRNALESSREAHRQEMVDMKQIIDEVRLELNMAKERIATDDGELGRAKATLSERTNLLRDMVNQTTAYQGDCERERARANTLEEAVSSYKRQLAEARDVGQQLEREIHHKDTHFCDAIRNERQQRKTMESELESSRKLLEDLLRKHAEMEKENAVLKDKVSRQENYIGRLQDKEKRERRSNALSTIAPVGSSFSRRARPSTSDSAGKHRGNIASFHVVDENVLPNLDRNDQR